jgi:hypothetical protein
MKSATDPDKKEVMRILREHGAVLERTKKHKIWRFPDGRIHVLPGSPGCAHAWKNQLHDLRNFLELNEGRGEPGERRPRKSKRARVRTIGAEAAVDVELSCICSRFAHPVQANPSTIPELDQSESLKAAARSTQTGHQERKTKRWALLYNSFFGFRKPKSSADAN